MHAAEFVLEIVLENPIRCLMHVCKCPHANIQTHKLSCTYIEAHADIHSSFASLSSDHPVHPSTGCGNDRPTCDDVQTSF